ncbi:hypothetical protein [Sinanaerobacter chloroacetimidivorans]|jgi:hypothetical protein|uniref:Uncharacterized protein n=1 Tax=Sinanaerobacter chloroacetimidivorans TaxID=2818044 RepID=A0A8J8B1K0_9FIRM|nr:hypothetical protein [Sinanaerobacter chloroacetimidivorans]MBR0598329.1 hypothetical protein [Sinanaerobacter chloroacetimidivorans]
MNIGFKVAGIIIILALACYVHYVWPHKIETQLTGIEYNQKDSAYAEEIVLRFDGWVNKLYNGNRRYVGKIYLESPSFTIKDETFTLIFEKDRNYANLYSRDTKGELNDYGGIFAKEDMSEIIIQTPDKPDPQGDDEYGIILAFPAKSRGQAVTLSLKYQEMEQKWLQSQF